MWCVAEVDEAYRQHMEDVLELYERPYNPQEPVVCLDEKPVVLHRDVRPATQAQPRQPAKRDYEYERCGTANVFCAVEPLAGRHFTWPTPNRSGPQFAKMLERIARAYPSVRTIHLVLDNLSTHACRSLVRHLGPQAGEKLWNRFTIHHTPKHASWLNQAEIEISVFARQCLGSRRFASLPVLRAESYAWNRTVNRQRLKINWTFSRLDAADVFHQQLQLFTRSRH
jgi:DDE superfamily endonuclease